MSATLTKPSLLEVVNDALNDAYWSRRANVEECLTCAKNPAGVSTCHEEDWHYVCEYEEARKRIAATVSTDMELVALLNGEGETR